MVLMDLSKCLLIKQAVRPGYVLRKPYLMDLKRIVYVGLNIKAF